MKFCDVYMSKDKTYKSLINIKDIHELNIINIDSVTNIS